MFDPNVPVKCSECSVWWRGIEHLCKIRKTYLDNKLPNKPDTVHDKEHYFDKHSWALEEGTKTYYYFEK